MPESQRHDPLADLRARLHETRVAAERLAGEAATAAGSIAGGELPPPGWRTAGERAAVRDELDALADLLRAIRMLLPAELEQQLAEVLRQVLLLVRALIDWMVEQLPSAGAEPAPLRDIPIS